MCGILAYVTSKSAHESFGIPFSRVYKFLHHIKRRGPDSTSITITPTFYSVFTRLAINDPSPRGNQPFVHREYKAENQTWQTSYVYINGEIYNHRELAERYRIQVTSTSDCEIVAVLLQRMPFEEVVTLLSGEFAIAYIKVVEYSNGSIGTSIRLARDKMGIRPMYYAGSRDGTIVCSIPHCILAVDHLPVEVPPGMIYTEIRLGLTSRAMLTPYTNYPRLDVPTSSLSYEDSCYKLRRGLIEAVQKRLHSDRPIGAFLSGGLDSSIVVAIMASLVGGQNVHTFSIGLPGSTDLEYAEKVAKHLNTKHTAVLFSESEGLQAIPSVIQALASKDITTVRASVGMYLLSKYIARNTDIKVVLSGEGSDELFCGYLYFHHAPSPALAKAESQRLLTNMYMYDILRADRSVSSNGLELRVPFLDTEFTDFVATLPCDYISVRDNVEKAMLRYAFRDMLPESVINRQKVAFSDGVSSTRKSWFKVIQDYVDEIIPDCIYNRQKYITKEAMYYSLIHESFFPGYNNYDIPYWMPKWTNATDPSARTLAVCSER